MADRNIEGVLRIPAAEEAEAALLAMIITRPDMSAEIIEQLTLEDFYFPTHRDVFEATRDLLSKKRPTDFVSLCEELTARHKLPAGGMKEVGSILKNSVTPNSYEHLIEIVREKTNFRALIEFGHKVLGKANMPEGDSFQDVLGKSQKLLKEIDDRASALDHKEEETFADHLSQATNLAINKSESSYLATGIDAIDKRLAGIGGGDLIVIAGRPSMGKTAFALNVAEKIAINNKDLAVPIFSLEMPPVKLANRFISSIGKIDNKNIKRQSLSTKEILAWRQATDVLSDAKIVINPEMRITPTSFRNSVRRYAQKYGKLGCIVVDYIQLMMPDTATSNETQAIGEITRQLKLTAMEYDVPIIALSQLNRSFEKRVQQDPTAIPTMSDLRAGGSIEQDADVIAFVHRPFQYRPTETALKTYAELHYAKARESEVGMEPMSFIGPYTKFQNISELELQRVNEYLSQNRVTRESNSGRSVKTFEQSH